MPDAVWTADACAGDGPRQTRALGSNRRNTALIHASLAQIIEGEILPRLALAHREDPRPSVPIARAPTPERVTAFAQALMRDDLADGHVRALLEEGLPLDVLLLDLLAPAARHLGYLWEVDEVDFLDVTAGLRHLHSLARALCTRLEKGALPSDGRRILLTPCPGETHLFSLALVASFFREAGWDVVLADSDDEEPIALVRAEWFDLIGVSLSCDVLLPQMANLISELRAASSNPGVRVIVGGPLFLRDPGCAAAVGADAAAEDGRTAVRIAETMVKA